MRRTMVSLLAAVALAAGTAHAAPIDGTFNYQGRLTSGGAPITGSADVRFSLWDSSGGGAQVGSTIDVLGVSVTDGLFNTDLDFGVDALNGDERWLQVEVRSPAGSGGYVNLGRQEVLGAPYAIQTRGIFVDSSLNVGIGTTNPQADLHVGGPDASLLAWDESQDVRVFVDGSGEPNQAPISAPGPSPFRQLVGADYAQELLSYTYGGQYHSYDLATGDLTSGIGTSFEDPGGFMILLSELNATVLSVADKGGTSDPEHEGLLFVSSSGGGEGGEISVANDDGLETIELLGGVSGGAGSFTMYNSSGSAIGDLVEAADGGRIRLFDSTTGMSYFDMQVDTSPGGGGALTIARNNAGDTGLEVNGNYGDSQSTALLLYGTSPIRFYTHQTGKDTVILPSDAIDAVEVLDEPGVASATADATVTLGGGTNVLLSRTITCPTAGYCVVIGTCDTKASHSAGTGSQCDFGVSDNGGFPTNQNVSVFYSSNVASGLFNTPVTVHGTFSVGAGAHTFELVALEFSGNFTARDMQLTVMFFPTAYGTVTPVALTRGGGTRAPMSPVDIKTEQVEAAAFDRNRRDAELAEVRAELEAMRSRLDELEQQRDDHPPRRATPPPEENLTGAVLGHNDSHSR